MSEHLLLELPVGSLICLLVAQLVQSKINFSNHIFTRIWIFGLVLNCYLNYWIKAGWARLKRELEFVWKEENSTKTEV